MRMRGSRVGKVLRFQVKVSKMNYRCRGLRSHALFCCHTKITATNEFERQTKIRTLYTMRRNLLSWRNFCFN